MFQIFQVKKTQPNARGICKRGRRTESASSQHDFEENSVANARGRVDEGQSDSQSAPASSTSPRSCVANEPFPRHPAEQHCRPGCRRLLLLRPLHPPPSDPNPLPPPRLSSRSSARGASCDGRPRAHTRDSEGQNRRGPQRKRRPRRLWARARRSQPSLLVDALCFRSLLMPRPSPFARRFPQLVLRRISRQEA